MRTLTRLFLSGALLFCIGFANAQSAARSSRDITPLEPDNPANAPQTEQPDTSDFRSSRGTPMPSYIDKLFQEGKVKEAFLEFERFKNSNKKIPDFDLLYLEYTAYQQAAMHDWNNETYRTKMEEIKKDIVNKFPNNSESYLLQIEEDMSEEQKIELATKAIEADPSNEMAYRERGRALMSVKKTKEACEDLEKVSYKSKLMEYQSCKDLN